MIKFKFGAAVVLAMLLAISCKDDDAKTLIKNFTEAICNDKLTYDEVINNFLKSDVDKTDFLINHLSLAREELRTREIKMEKIEIVNYEGGIKNRKMDPIETSNEKKSNVYFVIYNGEFLMPILIEKNRILSFSTMNKGGRRYFLENR